MFDLVAGELGGGAPIASWRRTYRTTESRIVGVLGLHGQDVRAARCARPYFHRR